jgi:hypothetical protein
MLLHPTSPEFVGAENWLYGKGKPGKIHLQFTTEPVFLLHSWHFRLSQRMSCPLESSTAAWPSAGFALH